MPLCLTRIELLGNSLAYLGVHDLSKKADGLKGHCNHRCSKVGNVQFSQTCSVTSRVGSQNSVQLKCCEESHSKQ